ncbi:MAG: hypothetical protein IKC86_02355 [Prevotella sp.]|nr:hypothetical protein [Prevotella sp.]
MILRKSGDTTVINQGSEGGGGGSQPSVALGPLLTSLNSEAMPSAEGYLHWTGSAWAFDTPTGGDPVDLTPYALKTWVQDNFAYKNDLVNFITKTEADGYYAALNHTHANYLPLSAGANKALTGSLYFSGNSGINWAGGVGMLACTPESGWTGISSSQWGVGALSAQGVIRSNANDILHYRNGTNYKIWDAYNFTPSDYLPLTGGTVESLTVTNGLDADSITVGSLVNSNTLAEYLDADAMQTWVRSLGYITETTADGRYLPLTAGENKPLTGNLYQVNGAGLFIKDTGGIGRMAVYMNNQNQFFVGFGMRQGGYDGYFDSNIIYLRTGSTGTTMTLDASRNVGIGTTSPAEKLDVAGNVKANGATLTNLLSWNVANADNLVISNNKIQLSVSGTPHNIVLFEGSTESLTSYAKFYERPMVKTGTNAYTNVALVSEVEAKQDIIHFLNTNGNDSEVDFSYLHLPLSNIGAGHASLDLSAYVTSSALTTALGAYLPLAGGTMHGSLMMQSDLSADNFPARTGHAIGMLAQLNQHSAQGDNGYRGGVFFMYAREQQGGQSIAQDKLNAVIISCLPEYKSNWYSTDYGLAITADDIKFKGASLAKASDLSGYLPLSAGGSTPLTGSLYWNVANQTDNLIISNNKIQLSVSGTPHNIVLFEDSTASLTSYAKFYERPMVKTGTNAYTNVALVSEVEAKQNIIHFLNTNDNDSEVSFTYLHLPLSNIGAGHASLDLSSYMPLSGDSTKDGNMTITGKLAVGTTTFDGSNAKLQVGGNMFATGSITSKSNAGNVSLGNGNISATNLYISTVVFGSSNNDPAIYIGNGHVYARNSQGETIMIV